MQKPPFFHESPLGRREVFLIVSEFCYYINNKVPEIITPDKINTIEQ